VFVCVSIAAAAGRNETKKPKRSLLAMPPRDFCCVGAQHSPQILLLSLHAHLINRSFLPRPATAAPADVFFCARQMREICLSTQCSCLAAATYSSKNDRVAFTALRLVCASAQQHAEAFKGARTTRRRRTLDDVCRKKPGSPDAARIPRAF
jgi:hypothetical protein